MKLTESHAISQIKQKTGEGEKLRIVSYYQPNPMMKQDKLYLSKIYHP